MIAIDTVKFINAALNINSKYLITIEGFLPSAKSLLSQQDFQPCLKNYISTLIKLNIFVMFQMFQYL